MVLIACLGKQNKQYAVNSGVNACTRVNVCLLPVLLFTALTPWAASAEEVPPEFANCDTRPFEAVLLVPATPQDGPDKGVEVPAYRIVNCGKCREGEVWITDSATGWIPRDSVVPLSEAAAVLAAKLEKSPEDAQIYACLVQVNVLLNNDDESSRLLANMPLGIQNTVPIRYVRAMVSAAVQGDGQAVALELDLLLQEKNYDEYWFACLMPILNRCNLSAEHLEVLKSLSAGHLDQSTDLACIAEAFLLIAEGKYGPASKATGRILMLNPYFPNAYYLHAIALSGLRDTEEELRTLNKAIEIWPGHHHGYYLRGLHNQEAGALEQAEADFRSAVSLNVIEDYRFPFALAKVILARENRKFKKRDQAKVAEACELLKTLSDKTDHKNFDYEFAYALALYMHNDYGEALKAMDRCESMDPTARKLLAPIRIPTEERAKAAAEE
ncbi:hypothetical protein Pan181_47740 [Aeoliella mucimassa]|uniref:Tetratricopeptide repeat protein n=2 Tax=Aeoliella mucimassa TaxID=2527972 RepID=A0A518AUZ0_9BACT|nr:hypothetical protein Pan181_47740 [Aeoliella mucimassa]